MDPKATRRERELYRMLLAEARPYRARIVVLLLLGAMGSGLALLTPLPLKLAVDSALTSRPLPSFVAALLPRGQSTSPTDVLVVSAALIVVLAVLSQIQEYAGLWLSTYTGQNMLQHFRSRLFVHVQRLSLRYHDATGITDPAYRIQYDASIIQDVAVDGIIPLVSSAVTVIAMLYVTARIDLQLACVALAVAPALFLVLRAYRSRIRDQWREAKRLDSAALSVVQEALGALRVVKAFGGEMREGARFVDLSGRGIRARVRAAHSEGAFGVVIGTLFGCGTAAVLLLGMRQVQAGALSLGDLLLVLGYLSQLYAPLKTMSNKISDVQSSLASAERVFALLDKEGDPPERPRPRSLSRARGAIAFDHVTFAYETGKPVLSDVSFVLAPGTHVGLVGATGAGKSTLVSLLLRFYDPSGGTVSLDGVDLRDYKLEDLRAQFGMVLQEPVLFSTTVAENILYARPGAHPEEVIAAAKAARAHDFITRLPSGYETEVGERGVRLSGGERQRISLARAFLKDAPVLILDEPTSSVDSRTEEDIMEALARLSKGRTTITISHRPTALLACDLSLHLELGHLTEVRTREAVHVGRAADNAGGQRND